MDQGDDGALELGAAAGVDGGREKLFQTIVSQIVSMKREMPEPFWSSTSWRRTMRPATNSWMMVMSWT